MRYELWAWVVTERDGSEGIIATDGLVPGTFLPLQSRLKTIADAMAPAARDHQRVTGRPVRLAHLVEQEGRVMD